jgi:hypothetical protein
MEEWIKVIVPLLGIASLWLGIASLWWKLTTSMATKAELNTVKTDLEANIAEVKADLKADVAEIKSDMADMKADLKGEIGKSREDTREIRQLLYKNVTESERQELKAT